MKYIFTLFLSAGVFAANISSQAQIIPGALGYHEQALMFSNYNYTGTARIQGLGGTQISLGGDISSALSNPAGLGFYNRSEITLTPSLNTFSAESSYLGQNTSAARTTFNIDNIGIVFNKTKSDYEPGNWRGGSFAISFSKINEFNSDITYQGANPNNDIIDFYVQDANRQNVDPGDIAGVTRGSYENFLLSEFLDAFVDGNDTTYFPFYERTFFGEFPLDNFPTVQSETINTSGSQNQWNFSYGGNYGDIFYFGLTLGIQSLRYNVTKTYSENYPTNNDEIVISSRLVEDLSTEGIGVNGTFGIIARPINQMTIGFSLITPTFMSLSERYYYSSSANYDGFDMSNYGSYFDTNYDLIVNTDAAFTTFYESSAFLTTETFEPNPRETFFDYTITTPLRLNGGLTFFVNKNGFISADIEYVDYSNMSLEGRGGSLESENNDIKELYQSTLNYRLGGEWRLKKFRVRAGYNLRGNPYASENVNMTAQAISGGFGLRTGKFYLDLTSTYKQFDSEYFPYNLDNPDNNPTFDISPVRIKNTDLNFILSAGLFF